MCFWRVVLNYKDINRERIGDIRDKEGFVVLFIEGNYIY